MLRIKKRNTRLHYFEIIPLLIGGYMLTLIGAPAATLVVKPKAINVAELPAPAPKDNRIIIPKIGVNIPYGEGKVALDNGAQWRLPDRGSPQIGGNFIIAAHRFTLARTPTETIRRSPFYHIDKLAVHDPILIDYNGKRYEYTINKMFNVRPTQVEIEAKSEVPKLTLYTCDLAGAASGRVVVTAESTK